MNVINLAGCIILNEDNEILLLYRPSHDHWELPGGKVELGETFLEAAIREIYEELGCNINIVNLNPVGDANFEEKEKKFYYVWFLGHIKNNEAPRIKEPQIFSDLRYFSIFDLPKNLSSNMKFLSQKIQSKKIQLE